MKKYQRLAQQIISQIELGVWLPGDKLPSLREQVASSGMSFMTVVRVSDAGKSGAHCCQTAVRLLRCRPPDHTPACTARAGDAR